MRFIRQDSGYHHNIHIVELEGDENCLPDGVLITMADGLPREEALEIHVNKGVPPHFGGSVERRRGKRTRKMYARISVCTD